jgi:hypothetical protein
MAEHLAQREPEPAVFGDGNAMCAPARPDSSAEKALIGVDVAHPGEKRLVEERGLDGKAPAAEKSGKLWRGDIKRLGAWWCETGGGGQAAEFQAAESARIDEAKLTATGELEPCMGVRGERAVGSGDKQPPRHAEMDDPLSVGPLCVRFGTSGTSGSLRRALGRCGA